MKVNGDGRAAGTCGKVLSRVEVVVTNSNQVGAVLPHTHN